MRKVSLHIAVYLPSLNGGGAERLHLNLAPHFLQAGCAVTFVLDRREGELQELVPPGVRVVSLQARRPLHALPKLVAWLRAEQPDVLVANMEHMNIVAVLARILARTATAVVATQHIPLRGQIETRNSWKYRILPFLYRNVLPLADRVVTVSRGVAQELSVVAPNVKLKVIYNGVIDPARLEIAAAPAHHWLLGSRPVMVSVGRLASVKDYPTLLRAAARVLHMLDARLIILGTGPEQDRLVNLANSLGIADRVAFVGFVQNPFPTIRAARLLVLTSRVEGFGNVIAEALACGTPVVSTDAPYGPGEILAGGRFGRLVPVGDIEALADAMSASLSGTVDRELLVGRGLEFTIERAAFEYLELFKSIRPTWGRGNHGRA